LVEDLAKRRPVGAVYFSYHDVDPLVYENPVKSPLRLIPYG